MAVSAGGRTPTVYNLDNLPDTIASALLPARLLLPMAANMEGKNLTYMNIGAGSARTVQWKVTDLMLWQAQAQGRGLEQVSSVLVDYVAAYVDAAATRQALLGGQVTTEDLTLMPGVFLYPANSLTAWFGVEVVWQIKEIVT